ncbi:helix-turn-helix domain-containing protein [Mycoplasmatota bacterium WC44]
MSDIPYKKIGAFFNGKDHSTVINACDKISFGIKNEENIRNDVENIKNKVEN